MLNPFMSFFVWPKDKRLIQVKSSFSTRSSKPQSDLVFPANKPTNVHVKEVIKDFLFFFPQLHAWAGSRLPLQLASNWSFPLVLLSNFEHLTFLGRPPVSGPISV